MPSTSSALFTSIQITKAEAELLSKEIKHHKNIGDLRTARGLKYGRVNLLFDDYEGFKAFHGAVLDRGMPHQDDMHTMVGIAIKLDENVRQRIGPTDEQLTARAKEMGLR